MSSFPCSVPDRSSHSRDVKSLQVIDDFVENVHDVLLREVDLVVLGSQIRGDLEHENVKFRPGDEGGNLRTCLAAIMSGLSPIPMAKVWIL